MPERRPPPEPPPAVLPARDDEERRLFERELAGVRPLPPEPARIPRSPTAGTSRASARPAPVRDSPGLDLVVEREGGSVTAARYGVSRETLHELARGEPAIDARCDLHGLRAPTARQRLRQFIEDSAARGRRAVLVVCGRGRHSGLAGPVLLDVATLILTQPPAARHVQAFTSAAPALGGDGAIMVRLRRAG